MTRLESNAQIAIAVSFVVLLLIAAFGQPKQDVVAHDGKQGYSAKPESGVR